MLLDDFVLWRGGELSDRDDVRLRSWLFDNIRIIWLSGVSMVYLALGGYQLHLPGLHYDEAKEAGINAMELIGDMPVTAFRNVTIELFGVHLPLMVQDYIGALNVFLAAPLLAIFGVNTASLRLLPLVTGLIALLLMERAVSEWMATCAPGDTQAHVLAETTDGHRNSTRSPISPAGLAAVTILAVSPTFIFWSRQGLFVTNLMQPLCLLMVWQGLRWMRTGRPSALIWAALAAGLALYAKLMALWIVAPLVLLVVGRLVYIRVTDRQAQPELSARTAAFAIAAFLIPLTPLAWFNLKSGGTLTQIVGNASLSYYGVDNRAWIANLAVRLGQVGEVLSGYQFWYLGGSFKNPLATWLAGLSVIAGVWRCPRCMVPPATLIAAAVLMSVVTISDLFVTHYALLYPFLIATATIGLERLWNDSLFRRRRLWAVKVAVGLVLALWVGGNLAATVQYHRVLTASGGLADHSDASTRLARYLRNNGMSAPLALDWGIDAPVRFLSQGAVTPIEVFGYESVLSPDDRFTQNLEQFLPNPDYVYLLHAADATVFQGRREAFVQLAAEHEMTPWMADSFSQRDGRVLFEVWRVRDDEEVSAN